MNYVPLSVQTIAITGHRKQSKLALFVIRIYGIVSNNCFQERPFLPVYVKVLRTQLLGSSLL